MGVPASTSKKAVVYRFEREPVTGFVNPQTYRGLAGVEVLTLSGSVSILPYEQIRMVCFVRDFEGTAPESERRLFANRPKTEGLWVRMRFRDGAEMDGLLPNNLLGIEPFGFTILPPDPASNSQRMFVPRAALAEIKVAGVVGSPVRTARRKAKPAAEGQLKMFE
jgi:hypothetical protein